MSDTDLIRYLHLTPEEAVKVIPKLTPEKRAAYLRMGKFADEWNLYTQGGPPPNDIGNVLIDTERSTKKRRAWR